MYAWQIEDGLLPALSGFGECDCLFIFPIWRQTVAESTGLPIFIALGKDRNARLESCPRVCIA
ncbi:MAG: hypothetical protein AB7D36_06185 [Oscillospiraceae bacterium]